MMSAGEGSPAELAEAVVASMLVRDAFTRWMGAELVAVRAGHCTLRMRVREDMLNGFGVAHGGIAFSLADSAMAFACNSTGRVTVAVDNSVSYPAAIRLEDELVAMTRKTYDGLAMDAVTSTPEGFESQYKKDIAQWGPFIKRLGIEQQ